MVVTTRFTNRLLTVFIVAAVCMLVAACSPGANAAGANGTNGADGTNDAEAIYIGVTGPLTGDNAEYGRIWQTGFDLALEEINGAGGINGRPLKYVFEDTQSDPKQTPAVARKFVDDKRIVAVIGDFSSTASMAASPIYQREGLFQLGITNSHPEFTDTGDFIWSNSSSQQDTAPALARLAAKELGHRRIAVLSLNTDWGQSSAELFQEAAKDLGAEIVAHEAYLPNEKDFRSILTKVRDAKPDVLALISYYNDASLILQQREAVGLDVEIVAIDSNYSPKLIELAGAAAEGIYTLTQFHPDDSRPEVQRFVTAYKDKYGVEPDNFAAGSYDGLKIIAQVLQQTGPDRRALRDGIAAATDLETVKEGIAGFGPARRFENPNFVYLLIKNGEFTVWQP